MKKILFIILSVFALIFFSDSSVAFAKDYGCSSEYNKCVKSDIAYPNMTCISSVEAGGQNDCVVSRSLTGVETKGSFCCKDKPVVANDVGNSSIPLCCPKGYGVNCPAGTDTATQCCKVIPNPKGLASYGFANKIECTTPPSFKLCAQISDPIARDTCENKCSADGTKIWTAIGCIPTDSNGILTAFVRLALSMGGGIVLLMTLAAAFQLTTSKGDPKATEEAKNKITAAVSGLLFIIFSMVLLKTIGVTVLQIPGF